MESDGRLSGGEEVVDGEGRCLGIWCMTNASTERNSIKDNE